MSDKKDDSVETVKQSVVKAINLITEPIELLSDNIPLKESDIVSIAKGINLLEYAQSEMECACKRNNWDSEICSQLADACRVIGRCLANVLTEEEDKDDSMICPDFEGKEGLSILGKVLATLVTWNIDE